MDKSEQNRGLLAPQRRCSLQLQILSTVLAGMGKPGVLREAPAGTAPFLPEAEIDSVQFYVNILPGTYYMPAHSVENRRNGWMVRRSMAQVKGGLNEKPTKPDRPRVVAIPDSLVPLLEDHKAMQKEQVFTKKVAGSALERMAVSKPPNHWEWCSVD